MSGWAEYERQRRELRGEPSDPASVFGGSLGPFCPAAHSLRTELAACRRVVAAGVRMPRLQDAVLAEWELQPPLGADLRRAHKLLQDLAMCLEMRRDDIWPSAADPTRWELSRNLSMTRTEQVHEQFAAFMERATAVLRHVRHGGQDGINV